MGEMVLQLFTIVQRPQMFLGPAEMILNAAPDPFVVGCLATPSRMTPAITWSACSNECMKTSCRVRFCERPCDFDNAAFHSIEISLAADSTNHPSALSPTATFADSERRCEVDARGSPPRAGRSEFTTPSPCCSHLCELPQLPLELLGDITPTMLDSVDRFAIRDSGKAKDAR